MAEKFLMNRSVCHPELFEKSYMFSLYKSLYDGMIAKDGHLLHEVLDNDFVLVHMTGMRQSKKNFINAVLDGTLNYYSAVHENLSVETQDKKAVVVGQSYVKAAVFGGRKNYWHLQLKCNLKKTNGKWKITQSIAETY